MAHCQENIIDLQFCHALRIAVKFLQRSLSNNRQTSESTMVKSGDQDSPTSPTGFLSVKRRKTEDEGRSFGSKKQRTRVSFSCGECHRRKQKCNREIPCSHCIARKVPELCKAYTPGKADQDFNARISRLERIVEMALPQYCSSETPPGSFSDTNPAEFGPGSASMEEDSRSQIEEQDPSGGTFRGVEWYGNSASGSVAPDSVIAQLQNVVKPAHRQERQNSSQLRLMEPSRPAKTSFTPTGSSSDLGQPDPEPSAADNLNNLMQECGLSPHKISELFQELPPQRFSESLLNFYFDTINWTRYPISEREFRAAYASICANGIGINPNDIRFLPLLFVVLAVAVRLAPEHMAGDSRTRRITSLRYYWSSRRSLLIAAAIQPDSLDAVLTRLLSARFLTFDRRITECWSQLGAAVRTAQAMGLHRDGSAMRMDPSEVEYRRRIWSYLYHADRSYALVLGRPNAIQDDYTSTHLPLNIDELPTVQTHNPLPLSSPTSMTFVILRHNLAAIIGRMVHHFQQVRTPSHYSEALSLDDELMAFVHNLPPHFSLSPDTSLDESSKYLRVHRFLLITEIWFVRISLHRPYLLRRPSHRYQRSRKACFEAAIKDFECRQAFRGAMPREAQESLSNAYREFQTAMISGIYLVLEPTGKDADAMHAILDGFIRDHEGLREIDGTTRRELKTIEFLKRKASQAEGKHLDSHPKREMDTSPDNVSDGVDHPMDAQLLLSLQQSGSARLPRPPFPTLLSRETPTSRGSPHPSPSTHPAPYLSRSPTFQRLQQGTQVEGYALSPSGSGSPSADDESAAQSLLDHWCNPVSNGVNSFDGSIGTPGLSWGGGSDYPGFAPAEPGTEADLLNGSDGSDWSYWEALVNQIQKTS